MANPAPPARDQSRSLRKRTPKWVRRFADIAAASLVAAMLVVCVAWIVIEQFPWKEDASGRYTPIGVVSSAHTAIGGGQFLSSDPSLDLWVLRDGEGDEGLAGIFRLNPFALEDNDGAAKVGLILPSRSQFTVGGVGEAGQMIVMQLSPDPQQEPRPFSCSPSDMPGTDDARQMGTAFWQGLSWSADCLSESTVIWIHLPAGQTDGSGELAEDSQRVLTATAAMIDFRIPAFGGVARTGFDTWLFRTQIESGRILPDVDTQPLSAVLPGVEPVLALHDTDDLTIGDPSPDTDRMTRAWLEQDAYTWQMALDGGVTEYSATLTKSGEHSWRQLVDFLAPASAVIVLTGGLTWAYRRFRPSSKS